MDGRRYQQTHPWISFQIDLRFLDHVTWFLFGEALSKCEDIAGAPLRPAVAEKLHQIYLSKGIHATTSIEGNTLSEEEVRARVQGDLDLPLSREYLGLEIDNVLAVCNDIVADVADGKPLMLRPQRIAEFNRRIQQGLPLKEGVEPGKVRQHSVTVGGYRGAPAEDCPYLLARLCEWLNNLQAPANTEQLAFPLAVLKAILAHLYIAWIHPFGDGNGRTARLIEFQLLIEAGVPSPAAQLLSNHYNQTRGAYYVELDRTSRGDYQLNGFIRYAMQGFVDGLREQITEIRRYQMDVTWENYVHETFDGQDTPAKIRQRTLVLDMPDHPVLRSGLRYVSPRVAELYAGKTDKTVSRDLNELETRSLIVRTGRGILANRRLVEAFLPVKAER